MFDVEVMEEVDKLCSLYESRFGKEVDCIGLPTTMSQEKLLLTLRIIVNTGDSVLTGFKKVRDSITPYTDYLAGYHSTHPDIQNEFTFDKPCPLCHRKVSYYELENSYMYKCQTKNCYKSQFHKK